MPDGSAPAPAALEVFDALEAPPWGVDVPPVQAPVSRTATSTAPEARQ
jgi:hypothetical protein